MIDINEFVPRTQADRYNHAVLEQLIKLNENIEKLIPKPQIIEKAVELPLEKKTRKKKE